MKNGNWPAALALLILTACGEGDRDDAAPEGPAPAETATAGETLYGQHCLSCHQADGRGVPYFQPPLVGGEWVTGDPVTLAAYVITGGFDSASRTDSTNENVMPAFDYLSNEDLADILTYVRTRFGDNAGAVTHEQVAQGREMAGS